jgi:hypothetical protein
MMGYILVGEVKVGEGLLGQWDIPVSAKWEGDKEAQKSKRK